MGFGEGAIELHGLQRRGFCLRKPLPERRETHMRGAECGNGDARIGQSIVGILLQGELEVFQGRLVALWSQLLPVEAALEMAS